MKTLVLTFLLMNLIQSAYAGEFTSTIHSIDYGSSTKVPLIRFNNGRVIFIKPHKYTTLENLQRLMEDHSNLRVNVDENNFLIDTQTTSTPIESDVSEEFFESALPYTPTIVKSKNTALKIFKTMRKDYTDAGQCFNRAHVWSYEAFKSMSLNSMKIFMFFTDSYIRKYKFHWWFHVTPMVYVGNSKTPKTLDRRYTSGPLSPKLWSDIFIKSKRTCPKVKTFNDYWLNQEKQHCYHIYTNMYFVIPRDIEKKDIDGTEKVEFDEKTLQRAYKDAFKTERF